MSLNIAAVTTDCSVVPERKKEQDTKCKYVSERVSKVMDIKQKL